MIFLGKARQINFASPKQSAITAACAITALLPINSAFCQSLNSDRGHFNNHRYIAVSLGQKTQNYRELDNQGLTHDGIFNRESGQQNAVDLELRWQFDTNLVLALALQRQNGATNYTGYLQAGDGSLTPYKAKTGNVAKQYGVSLGYALPFGAWQLTPLFELSNHYWQRNLVQYSETYRYRSQGAGLRLAWTASNDLTFEAQALSGTTQPAQVSVADLGFNARQSAGRFHRQHLAAAYTVAYGWRVQAKFEQSRYNHGASPVVNGLQAPPNQHRPSAISIGIQKLF